MKGVYYYLNLINTSYNTFMDKIFSFIINKNTKKVLLLLGNPEDPQYKRSFWYVVTGGRDMDSSLEDTVKREIKEETGLVVKESIYLNWIFKYQSLGIYCTEYVYASFVYNENVFLNEENINYKWCDIDEFIELIEWLDDKDFLRQVVKSAINGEIYIKENKIDVYY